MRILAGPWQLAAIQLLEFYIVARIFEIAASSMRAKQAFKDRGVRPPHEPWYWSIVVVHTLLFVACGIIVVMRGTIPPKPVLVAALVVLGLAILLRGWVLWSLRGRWNVKVLDPGDIVTTGPYRFIRHPNYVAVILEVAALPIALGAYEVAVLGTLANAIVLSWRIPFEERLLSCAHSTYRTIMMSRPRFLPFGGRSKAHQSTSPL
jgi:methyltransferase